MLPFEQLFIHKVFKIFNLLRKCSSSSLASNNECFLKHYFFKRGLDGLYPDDYGIRDDLGNDVDVFYQVTFHTFL